MLSEAAEAEESLSVLLMRPSGPLETEGRRRGGEQQGGKEVQILMAEGFEERRSCVWTVNIKDAGPG